MSKNTHLNHCEDLILIEGSAGSPKVIKFLKEMVTFLSGKPGSGLAVTTKYDGAPAIVCGTDPADGKFFVGTKSVFAKTAPKMCKSLGDIQAMYDGVLAQKLTASFQHLQNAGIKGVLQGDLMFTNDKKTEKIDGKRYITFRPNTLTYAVDPNSKLGKQIQRAAIGIVFHTKYRGQSMAEMSASFDVNDGDFKSGGQVWAQKSEFKDIGKVASLTNQEKSKYQAAVRRTEGSLSQCKQLLDKIQSGKKTLQVDTEFLKFFNNYVKEGKTIPSVEKAYADFMYHMAKEYDKVIKKYKTLKSQSDKVGKFIETIDFIETNERQFKMLIASYMNIQFCKNILVDKMKKVQALRLFVDMGNGDYQVTADEGYVCISGTDAVKLVDRLEFSKLNFSIPKAWDK
jgi:hypothetical protein